MRKRWKILATVTVVIVIPWMIPPLYGTLWRMMSIPFKEPIQQWPDAAARHADWFKRFYTGPKPDAFYIEALREHKDLMEAANTGAP